MTAWKPLRWPIGIPASLAVLCVLFAWWRNRRRTNGQERGQRVKWAYESVFARRLPKLSGFPIPQTITSGRVNSFRFVQFHSDSFHFACVSLNEMNEIAAGSRKTQSMTSRYVVGIDLGTTNSALAYIDTGARRRDRPLPHLMIPQVVQPGVVEDRPLLPSFLYLPGPERAAGRQPEAAVGAGSRLRRRRVRPHLRQSGADPAGRLGQVVALPCRHRSPRADPAVEGAGERPARVAAGSQQPLPQAPRRGLEPSRWRKDVAENRLENQDIILTVPASFDAVARELTVEAARAAGLEHITLLEEPQAAFYAWIDASKDDVAQAGRGRRRRPGLRRRRRHHRPDADRRQRGSGQPGADARGRRRSHPARRRQHGPGAGPHAAAGLRRQGDQARRRPDADALAQSAGWPRRRCLPTRTLTSAPVTVLGRGSRVIGGTIKGELTRADVEKVLLDGFFPGVPSRRRAAAAAQRRPAGDRPALRRDPAITKHLACSWAATPRCWPERATRKSGKKKAAQPTAVLFNGGVFKATPLRRAPDRGARPMEQGRACREGLPAADLDLAVAGGAAYYGLVRRGKGIRIRGGTARPTTSASRRRCPPCPAVRRRSRRCASSRSAWKKAPRADVPGQEFGLVVGEPAEFRFLGSTVRRADPVGTLVEEWQGQIEELSPDEHDARSAGQGGTHGAGASAQQGDGGRHAGIVVHQPRRQARGSWSSTCVNRARNNKALGCGAPNPRVFGVPQFLGVQVIEMKSAGIAEWLFSIAQFLHIVSLLREMRRTVCNEPGNSPCPLCRRCGT